MKLAILIQLLASLVLLVPVTKTQIIRDDIVGNITVTAIRTPHKPIKVGGVKTKARVPTTKPVVQRMVSSQANNCEGWLAQAGIQLTRATRTLILKESNCRPNAVNPTSGACGIPQAYPCSKMKCALNNSGAVCQLKWMQSYVMRRYGSWDSALSFWYAQCGTNRGCWY
jgi:hypothetical protein